MSDDGSRSIVRRRGNGIATEDATTSTIPRRARSQRRRLRLGSTARRTSRRSRSLQGVPSVVVRRDAMVDPFEDSAGAGRRPSNLSKAVALVFAGNLKLESLYQIQGDVPTLSGLASAVLRKALFQRRFGCVLVGRACKLQKSGHISFNAEREGVPSKLRGRLGDRPAPG